MTQRCLRMLWMFVAILAAAGSACADDPSQALAALIDRRLNERFEQEQIVPAPPADDAEFVRRLYLDLIGAPPTPEDVRAFLSDNTADKRDILVETLLNDPRHADHFARTWRALLLPEADSDVQLRYFQPGLEAWLRQERLNGSGFDDIVRGLLAVPIAGIDQPPQLVLKDLRAPNPVAFIASKAGDPGTTAASATRLFLGIRLECAQCHNHPFDAWTQAQFWNQAAFFAGIERKGNSPFSPLSEAADRRQITIMGTETTVPVLFLDGGEPSITPDTTSRADLANWITSPDNPWFARAIVNRVWAQFMGEGLVDPVDDFGASNPPSHPELLDELARTFADSGFDMTLLQSAICRSDAYQRSSRVTHSSQTQVQRFAKMAIKPMTGEQFFLTLSQAIGYKPQTARLGAGRDDDPVRRRILNQFPATGLYADPETSVSQALILINGELVNRASIPDSSQVLKQLQMREDLSTDGQIEELFLLALARLPRQDEQQIFAEYLKDAVTVEHIERLGDILWTLLNTAEFRWNH